MIYLYDINYENKMLAFLLLFVLFFNTFKSIIIIFIAWYLERELELIIGSIARVRGKHNPSAQ